MLTYLIVACIHLGMMNVVFATGYGHFSGGSMSYVVEKTDVAGTYEAHIDLITGWVLGKGPCGPSCSNSDIGKETLSTRAVVESAKHDPIYFGNWTMEDDKAGLDLIINDIIKSNATEKVLSISQIGKWEQEQMGVTVKITSPNDKVEIVFEGYSWRDLPLQGSASDTDGKWHLQSQFDLRVRSDTGKPNASPKALVKPFYRVLLNSITQITIPGIDSDGDYVKCKIGVFVEAGSLSQNPLPGLTVNENCTITINASSALGYTDDLWGGIAVTMRDYNKDTIMMNGKRLLGNNFAIGGSTVQFLIQTLEHIYQPEFVNPTHPSNHRFYLYAGTTWNVRLFAQASENTSIAEFVVIASQHEVYNISEKYDDPTGRERVKCAIVTWTPESSDKGEHIICVRAIDDSGVDTNVDRCFIIQVKDKMFHATNVSSIKPYFVDLPTFNETLECDIDATCVFPIYVHSPDKIVDIDVEVVYEVTKQGGITQVQHNGDLLYKMDLALMHNQDGPAELCLTATDVNGIKSDRVCIRSEIIPADPCESAPCLNSGKCTRRENDTADYECKCLNDVKFEGKNCDLKVFRDCDPNPCIHGKCLQRRTGGYLCNCRGSGFDGKTCAINIDDCKVDSCNGSGICKDGVKGFTCSCYGRYNGTDCSEDLCPSEPEGQLSCNGALLPGCNPHPCGKGKCLSGGKCVCPLANRKDINCSTAKGDLGPYYAKVTIVPPTLVDKSDIVCYTTQNCSIDVYIASPNSTSPTLSIEAHVDITQHVIVEQPTLWSGLPDIQNMFKSEVVMLANTEGHKYVCLIVSDGNSNERRCFSVTIKSDPAASTKSFEYKQKNRAIKFVDPTPKGDTRFVCFNGTQYHLLLYTSVSPNGSCDAIMPSEDDIKVFDPTTPTSGVCQTEVTFTFDTLGSKHICFQSSPNASASQLRCFDVSVQNSDPCANNPCQNNAKCFHDVSGSTAGVYCECLPKYSGDNCGTGPCLPSDNTCTNGYCHVENRTITCMCPIGYNGNKCDHSLPDDSLDPYTNGARFTDTAITQTVTCVRNRPCSLSLVSSGRFLNADRPNVAPGYVHPTINILDLYTDSIKEGSFLSSVVISGKQTGVHDLCLQILNKDGVNEDEICIKVEVTEARSALWGQKEKPHFVNPSLPPSSDVICFDSEPCHIVVFATPGESAQGNECVELHVTSDIHLISHITSPCKNCSAVQDSNNCTFDLVMFPESDTFVCLATFTSVSQTSGEKRCYNVAVKQNPVRKGCQVLHCLNGGFCDGHEDTAMCYCPLPYSGLDCNEDTSVMTPSNPQAFKGLTGVPQVVKCYQNIPCVIPFSVEGPSPNISMGYVSPGLDVIPSAVSHDASTNLQIGAVTITPLAIGTHRYCVQMISGSTVVDELCTSAVIEDMPEQPTDKTKPYFQEPTLPTYTTVLCEAGKACHLELHFPQGTLFNSTELCPTVTDVSSDAGHKAHVFPSTNTSKGCRSDVSYIPPTSAAGNDELLCFEVTLPSKRGERRCFNVHIVADIQSGLSRPCLSKTCEYGSICIAEFPSNDNSPVLANCICTMGHSGDDCANVVTAAPDLPGVSGINATTSPNITSVHTPHFDGNAGLPERIQCELNKPCQLFVQYHGESNHPPKLGHLDADLTVIDSSVLSIDDHTHIQIVKMLSSKPANQTLCVQTTIAGEKHGENVDEICTTVETLQPGSLVQVASQELATIPDHTTITCKANSICHLTFVSSTTTTCPKLRECGVGIPGAHLYSRVTTSNVCIYDVAIKTKASNDVQDLCLSAVTSNDTRHIAMRTVTLTDFGPCQKLHCKNGGSCDNQNGTAVCLCVNLYRGIECELAPCTTALPVVEHATHTNVTVFSDGSRVNYSCSSDYTLSNTANNGYTCSSRNNSWIGEQPECIPKNCTSPLPDVANATHTILAVFQHGTRVIYTCASGYKFLDPNTNGYTCSAGNDSWIGQQPQCIPKNCTKLLPAVVKATHTSASVFPHGTKVNYVCLDNYEFRFQNTNGYTCDAENDQWTGAKPECIPKNCTNPLPVVANATPTALAVFQHGTRVNYTCATGYQFLDPNTNGYTCSAGNDSWIGQQPQCIPKNCTKLLPTVVKATHTSASVFPHGTKVNYVCLDNYEFRFQNTNGYTCDAENDQWTGAKPECIPKNCTNPLPVVANATPTALAVFQHDTRVNYTCATGYQFLDPNTNGYTCSAGNDSWIGQQPQCIPKNCSSTLPDIGNATHTSTTIFPHGTRVNYTCLDGYGFSNPDINGYTCDAENNIWLGQAPLCISTICTKQLPEVENATHANLTAVSDGVKVVYTCLDGYKFITPNANGYTCTSRTNSWIGKTPQCVSKDTCDWKDTSKAHKAVKQGMTSCYCMVQTPGESTPRKLQIIKRRPVVTMTQMLTAAGMGAGGMGGGLGVALILYLVVTKVMKKKPGKRPLPTPSPRTTRVGPRK